MICIEKDKSSSNLVYIIISMDITWVVQCTPYYNDYKQFTNRVSTYFVKFWGQYFGCASRSIDMNHMILEAIKSHSSFGDTHWEPWNGNLNQNIDWTGNTCIFRNVEVKDCFWVTMCVHLHNYFWSIPFNLGK